MRDKKDWNYDRFHTALAMMFDVQNDMMRCVNSGEVNDVVKERMIERLKMAGNEIGKTVLCHD